MNAKLARIRGLWRPAALVACWTIAVLAALSPWRTQWLNCRWQRVGPGLFDEVHDADIAFVEGYFVLAAYSDVERFSPGGPPASSAGPAEVRSLRWAHAWMHTPQRGAFVVLGVQRDEHGIDTLFGFAFVPRTGGNWAIVIPAWYLVLLATTLAMRGRLPRWRLFRTGLRTADGRCRACDFPLAAGTRRCPVCRTSARALGPLPKLAIDCLAAHAAGSWAWLTALLATGLSHGSHEQFSLLAVRFLVAPLLIVPAALFQIPLVTADPPMALSLPAYVVVACTVYAYLNRRRAAAVRWARGCCPGCGYDLQGNDSGICPECGQGWRPETCGNDARSTAVPDGPVTLR